MKINPSDYKEPDIQILIHHIYELKKGIRNLVLHTMKSEDQEKTEEILNKKGISFIIRPVNDKKINVFFGNPSCVDIVKSFGKKSLSDYSPEQDFILGIMLGYDKSIQFDRYLKRKNISKIMNPKKIRIEEECLN